MRRIVPFAILMLLACACRENLFDQFENLNTDSQTHTKKTWQPVDCTIDQVAFKEFHIQPLLNQSVMADILFVPDGENGFSSLVEHYKLGNDSLIATWNATAARVTVNGLDQTPDESRNDFTKPVTYRLYSSDGQYKEFVFNVIQGEYSDIPVASLISEKNFPGRKGWIKSVFKVSGQTYPCSSSLRGNISYGQDKKSYSLKFDSKSSVLGMNKGKRWCLIANAPDKSQLRNRVAYELASRTGLAWTPANEFCELFVNNKYCGLYQLMEKIKIDKNRVNITEITEQDTSAVDITGGYLLECDRYLDANSFRTAIRELPINIKDPDVVTDAQMKYLKDYFKRIEQLLYQKEKPDTAYRQYLDMGSFADVWMVLELTYCADARLPGSVWYYKDRNGPLTAGPVWDFDMPTFKNSQSYLFYDYEVTDFQKSDRSLWYSKMFQDPEFKRIVKQRWQIYRQSFETIPDFIDKEAEYIRKSAESNFRVWPKPVHGNVDYDYSWEDAVKNIRNNYLVRFKLIDNLIASW